MDWTDEGIVLGARRHGEANAVLELMTRSHGRHLGLVRGGFGLRQRPVLQAGNLVRVIWRARLNEHLGHYAVEGIELRAASYIGCALALYGVQHLAALCRLLPERDPHAEVFEQLAVAVAALALPARVPAPMAMASSFGILASPRAEFASEPSPSGTCRDGGAGWPDVKPSGSGGRRVSGGDGFAEALEPIEPLDLLAQRMAATRIARFELRLLAELGFGLDLASCAVTGATADLVYVSPRSGRAVSGSAGEPWRDKLLPLPGFLLDFAVDEASGTALRQGFALTGYFLARHVLEPRGQTLPEAREFFIATMARNLG